ncbi:MAG: M23 family metallopeptidase [Saprospiraceae bacterium]|nr:M23 family metallopeptidase [Saprospiraceae bacterium]
MKKQLLFLFLFATLHGCSWFSKSPRQHYEHQLRKEDKTLYTKWQAEIEKAFEEAGVVELPYSSSALLVKERLHIYSYDVELAVGEVFSAAVKTSIQGASIFLELFELDDGGQRTRKAYSKEGQLEYEVTQSGHYKVLVAGEMGTISNYAFNMNTHPLYGFPLKGGKNSDIQSFWGAPRDGGARKHEGIDIFAPKGTDLVAVTDGTIERRTGGLGGKQIWLYDKARRIRIYYAHLDAQIAEDGAKVQKGEVVGTVGNTGNARTTPPHVHFGTYLSKRGAVDPLGFVEIKPKISGKKHAPLKGKGLAAALNNCRLLANPTSSAAVSGQLDEGTPFYVYASSGEYYYVRTPAGRAGFLPTNVVQW